MASGAELDRARTELEAARDRLRALKRTMSGPTTASPRIRRWSLVRRMAESLRDTISTWLEAAPLVGDAPPEMLKRRAEIEATIARAQHSLAEVDKRRRELQEQQGRALAQLEAAANGWTLLYRELPTAAPDLRQSSSAALLGHLQRLLVESERALDEERQARADAQAAVASWRWLVDVSFPVFEQRLGSSDDTLLLPTLRRLIEELDARWASELRLGDGHGSFETAQDVSGARFAQRIPDSCSEEDPRDIYFERAAAAWIAQIETLLRAVDEARRQTREEKERGAQEAASAFDSAASWKKAAEDLRVELTRRDEALTKEKARASALESSMRFMAGRVARLRDAVLAAAAVRDVSEIAASTAEAAAAQLSRSLQEASEAAALKLASAVAQASEQTLAEATAQAARAAEAAQAAGRSAEAAETARVAQAAAAPEEPAGPIAPASPASEAQALAAPSLEPVLDPAWSRVLQTLTVPLGAASAQLRRLYAARMPDPYRNAVRATAGYVTQASDVTRVVREYLDETPLEDAQGRLDAAVEGALSAWEPVLARRGIRVSREIARDLPAARAATETLRLAIYQLVRNAWEAMPRGGTLTVRVSRDAVTGEARALFADSGAGFSEQARRRAFEPFVTEKAGHLGLGLALARRIARRAGGELTLEEARGAGAAVLLRLPPVGESPAAAAS